MPLCSDLQALGVRELEPFDVFQHHTLPFFASLSAEPSPSAPVAEAAPAAADGPCDMDVGGDAPKASAGPGTGAAEGTPAESGTPLGTPPAAPGVLATLTAEACKRLADELGFVLLAGLLVPPGGQAPHGQVSGACPRGSTLARRLR